MVGLKNRRLEEQQSMNNRAGLYVAIPYKGLKLPLVSCAILAYLYAFPLSQSDTLGLSRQKNIKKYRWPYPCAVSHIPENQTR